MSWSRAAIPRPSSVSHPWRCAHQQPLVAQFPPAKPPQRRPPSTSHYYSSTRPRRRNRRRKTYGLQFHQPGTTAASGNCLLLPTAGGSLRHNPGKIGRLIQAVRKVISAPARFWDRGARWFVVRLYVLEQLEKTAAGFLEER